MQNSDTKHSIQSGNSDKMPSSLGVSSNIQWHPAVVERSSKEALLNQKGAAYLLTGLSGSGKSTIAVACEGLLHQQGYMTALLDGDNLRHGLNADLGFSAEDRSENLRRIGHVAKLLVDMGVIVLISVIAPFESDRNYLRQLLEEDLKIIHVHAEFETCQKRDPKGLYHKQAQGLLKSFTGKTSPYEVPSRPDLLVDTERLSQKEAVSSLITFVLEAQKKANHTERPGISWETLTTDVLIIGGGTAGSAAALELGEKSPEISVIVVDRAFIEHSGCLAAGVNALNAVIDSKKDHEQGLEDYYHYVAKEFDHIVRKDLVRSIGEGLNPAAKLLEDLGMPILKDSEGNWQMRGERSVKINGEAIKPLLAEAVRRQKNTRLLEQVYIADLIVEAGVVMGAIGFHTKEERAFIIQAKAVIATAGGAAGLYRPNRDGINQHKMWYSPFNCGSGYALGIRHGAEMTSLEMRFIALRVKDTVAPTGTIAQGIKAQQVNSLGQPYLEASQNSTVERLHQTVRQEQLGLGPCALETKGISQEDVLALEKAYLNMAPSQVLKWYSEASPPSTHNVPITGTEPYIVGGHSACGYWVDTWRRTTLSGLYAAGDVCGGSPKKYVTGCIAEGQIAARTLLGDFSQLSEKNAYSDSALLEYAQTWWSQSLLAPPNRNFSSQVNPERLVTKVQTLGQLAVLEESMQAALDRHAGGIASHYRYHAEGLWQANRLVRQVEEDLKCLAALRGFTNARERVQAYELFDRLTVAKSLLAHLEARKETRWPCYQEREDYPGPSENLRCYVNSRWCLDENNQEIQVYYRPLVEEGKTYEHIHFT